MLAGTRGRPERCVARSIQRIGAPAAVAQLHLYGSAPSTASSSAIAASHHRVGEEQRGEGLGDRADLEQPVLHAATAAVAGLSLWAAIATLAPVHLQRHQADALAPPAAPRAAPPVGSGGHRTRPIRGMRRPRPPRRPRPAPAAGADARGRARIGCEGASAGGSSARAFESYRPVASVAWMPRQSPPWRRGTGCFARLPAPSSFLPWPASLRTLRNRPPSPCMASRACSRSASATARPFAFRSS